MSWVRPRSRVMASYLFRPTDLCDVLGSPPLRCSTTSVVRFRALHLLMPATYCPSHLRRYLKFLYGSRRCGFAGKIAIAVSPHGFSTCLQTLTGHLHDLNHDEFGGEKGRESHRDVDDSEINAGLRIVLGIAFDKVCFLRRRALECSFQKQPLHESANVHANLSPEFFVVRFENDPLRAIIQAGLDVERESANGNVFPFGAGLIVALQSARAPHHVSINLELAEAVDRLRVQVSVFDIREN